MNLPRFDINRIWLWWMNHKEFATDWTRDHFGFPSKSRAQRIRDDMLRTGQIFHDTTTKNFSTSFSDAESAAIRKIAKDWRVSELEIVAWAVRDYLERYTDAGDGKHPTAQKKPA